jgi:uncharacterized membrane protein (UPF0127 family)
MTPPLNKPSTLGALMAALVALLVVVLLSWLPTPARAASAVHFDRVVLRLDTRTHTYVFEVEVAKSPRQRMRGLMYRTVLQADQGMLFLSPTDQRVHMWMKNTPIPLDMLFIGEDGRVKEVVADSQPFSETVISSRDPVRAVLELAAGTAARLGVQPGDRIRSAVFPTR